MGIIAGSLAPNAYILLALAGLVFWKVVVSASRGFATILRLALVVVT